MKKSLILILVPAMCWLSSCKNNGNNNGLSTDLIGKTPVIAFTDTVYDFGSINQGEKVSHSFKFTNAGKVDLVISAANPSCGCTVTDYPKKAIAPGDGGQVDLTFDSSGKQGKQEKIVTVVTNCVPNTKRLYIIADIQPTKTQ
jgi:hypothetical protein